MRVLNGWNRPNADITLHALSLIVITSRRIFPAALSNYLRSYEARIRANGRIMMKMNRKNYVSAVFTALATGVASGSVFAGGLLDLEFENADFSTADPLIIDNPYWPLRPDNSGTPRVFTYISETEDECVIDQISVDDIIYGGTHLLTGGAPYGGLTAVQVVDTEWVFEDVETCDISLLPDDSAIKEFTLDWYMQDSQKNIWYVGELSQNFEEEGCGEYPNLGVNPDDDPQCFEGSWEAGVSAGEGADQVTGEAGIVVPSDEPVSGRVLENGTFFMQEIAYEAEDMSKILRQHATLTVEDGVEPGEYSDCRKTKEWTALDPGASVEHKWYCADGDGLVLIEGIGGGPTENEVLVSIDPVIP